MKLSSSYFSKKYHQENETKFFIFFKEISFYKSEFVQIISITKSETTPLNHHTFQIAILARFPVQFNPICILCGHCLHRFSKVSGSHFESIMVNSQRSRIDTLS